jgi:type VI secretion system ImpA family protein
VPTPADGAPLRIVLMADFSGHANRGELATGDELAERRPKRVDGGDIEEMIERFEPSLRLPIAGGPEGLELAFEEFDDFAPERLIERVEFLEEFVDLADRVISGSDKSVEKVRGWAANDAGDWPPAPPSRASHVPPGDALSDWVSLEGTPSASDDDGDSDTWIERIVTRFVAGQADADSDRLAGLVAQAAAAGFRQVIGHPDYRALEAAWRGANFLLRRFKKTDRIELYLLDISAEELARDLAEHDNLAESGLFKALAFEANGTDAPPWSMLVSLFEFDFRPSAIDLLGRVSQLARTLGTTFLGGFTADPTGADFALNSESEEAWTSLRGLPEATLLGLATPRFLLRPPYGEAYQPLDKFPFEEYTTTPEPGTDAFLWANSSLLVATLIGQAFIKSGLELNLNESLNIGEMALFVTRNERDEELAYTVERTFPSSISERLTSLGLMGVLAVRGRDAVSLASIRSLSSEDSALAGPWKPFEEPAAAGSSDDDDDDFSSSDDEDDDLSSSLDDDDDDSSSLDDDDDDDSSSSDDDDDDDLSSSLDDDDDDDDSSSSLDDDDDDDDLSSSLDDDEDEDSSSDDDDDDDLSSSLDDDDDDLSSTDDDDDDDLLSSLDDDEDDDSSSSDDDDDDPFGSDSDDDDEEEEDEEPEPPYEYKSDSEIDSYLIALLKKRDAGDDDSSSDDDDNHKYQRDPEIDDTLIALLKNRDESKDDDDDDEDEDEKPKPEFKYQTSPEVDAGLIALMKKADEGGDDDDDDDFSFDDDDDSDSDEDEKPKEVYKYKTDPELDAGLIALLTKRNAGDDDSSSDDDDDDKPYQYRTSDEMDRVLVEYLKHRDKDEDPEGDGTEYTVDSEVDSYLVALMKKRDEEKPEDDDDDDDFSFGDDDDDDSSSDDDDDPFSFDSDDDDDSSSDDDDDDPFNFDSDDDDDDSSSDDDDDDLNLDTDLGLDDDDDDEDLTSDSNDDDDASLDTDLDTDDDDDAVGDAEDDDSDDLAASLDDDDDDADSSTSLDDDDDSLGGADDVSDADDDDLDLDDLDDAEELSPEDQELYEQVTSGSYNPFPQGTKAQLDFGELLKPIDDDEPAGSPVSFSQREEFEELRKEIDPSTFDAKDPTRPTEAKHADWRGIQELATEILASKSKDLLTAARLLEALTKQFQFAGLRDGLHLMRLMCQLCWNRMFPEIEDEDEIDVRAAPFNWLDDPDRGARFPLTLRQTPVLVAGDIEFSWMDWHDAQEGKGSVSMGDFESALGRTSPELVHRTLADVKAAQKELLQLSDYLDGKMGDEAPALAQFRTALGECATLVGQMAERVGPPEGDGDGDDGSNGDAGAMQGAMTAGGMQTVGGQVVMAPRAPAQPTREDLYRVLNETATRLQKMEPHSPIPYLIQRACALGKLPFPKLMRALIREQNVLREMERELGIPEDDDSESDRY